MNHSKKKFKKIKNYMRLQIFFVVIFFSRIFLRNIFSDYGWDKYKLNFGFLIKNQKKDHNYSIFLEK